VVAQRVRAWGARLDEQATSTLRLLVSEVVTNAVRHTATPFIGLRLSVAGARLLVSVQDDSPVLPVVSEPGLDAWESENGRGLVLVAALAEQHGWRRTGCGKSVWFQLTLPEVLSPNVPACRAGAQRRRAAATPACRRADRPVGLTYARKSSRLAA
jgi:anti-sigma regulatory factor (Ser/Thr protein kinase)